LTACLVGQVLDHAEDSALGLLRPGGDAAAHPIEQKGPVEEADERDLGVRVASEVDIRCAIEGRGALKGLAARGLAERVRPAAVQQALADCVTEGRPGTTPG